VTGEVLPPAPPLTAVPTGRALPSVREVDEAVADVFGRVRQHVSPQLPDHERYKDAAMQYRQMVRAAIERNDRAGVESGMQALRELVRDIDRTWRR